MLLDKVLGEVGTAGTLWGYQNLYNPATEMFELLLS